MARPIDRADWYTDIKQQLMFLYGIYQVVFIRCLLSSFTKNLEKLISMD